MPRSHHHAHAYRVTVPPCPPVEMRDRALGPVATGADIERHVLLLALLVLAGVLVGLLIGGWL